MCALSPFPVGDFICIHMLEFQWQKFPLSLLLLQQKGSFLSGSFQYFVMLCVVALCSPTNVLTPKSLYTGTGTQRSQLCCVLLCIVYFVISSMGLCGYIAQSSKHFISFCPPWLCCFYCKIQSQVKRAAWHVFNVISCPIEFRGNQVIEFNRQPFCGISTPCSFCLWP